MKIIPQLPEQYPLQNVNAYRKDPLGFVKECFDTYGDIFSLKFLNRNVIITQRPEIAQYILQTNHRNYIKATAYRKLKLLLGEGLLTSEGEVWLKNRRLAQPAFHKKSIESFLKVMHDATEQMLYRWQYFYAGGRAFQLQNELSECTLAVVCEALLGHSLEKGGSIVNEELPSVLKFMIDRMLNPVALPIWMPLPAHQRFLRSKKRLEALIRSILFEKRHTDDGKEGIDLLTMLMLAKDEHTGLGMTTEHLVDEMLTFFLAGHETSAMGLTWVFYHLAKSPSIAQRVREEINQVVVGERVSLEQLTALKYTKKVIYEGLRLKPPIWTIAREALTDDVIGNYDISKGDSVVINNYWMHQHPEFWADPMTFNPERFSDAMTNAIHKHAFLPFGAGPRICIGNHFAMMEMTVILVQVFKRFKVQVVKEQIDIECSLTIRPKHGLEVFLEPIGMVKNLTAKSKKPE
ncbi:MAG: cytochrome P450 [Flammeovirgaceae bacterium]